MNRKAETILLVDDDIDYLEQTQLLLENAGWNVITAGGQKEAEECLERMTPDLAIVDLMMEKMDGGFALSYHIRRKCPGTPVILVTAVASETSIDFDAVTEEEKSWIKADVMLAKPVRFEQLEREIKRLLAAKE